MENLIFLLHFLVGRAGPGRAGPGRVVFELKWGKMNAHKIAKHLSNSRYGKFECGRSNLSKLYFSI